MKQQILMSMPMYDRVLAARVLPWTHHLHSWIGYVYVYDDDDVDSILVYFTPVEGAIQYRVHRTRVEYDENSILGYRLTTNPDPEVDPQIGQTVIDDMG